MLNDLLRAVARRMTERAALRAMRHLGPRDRADLPLPPELARRLGERDEPFVEPLVGPRRRP